MSNETTTEAKHTRGRWYAEDRDSGYVHLTPERRILTDIELSPGAKPTTYLIGTVTYPSTCEGTVGAEERVANARLIAASPDLYAACEAAVIVIRRSANHAPNCKSHAHNQHSMGGKCSCDVGKTVDAINAALAKARGGVA